MIARFIKPVELSFTFEIGNLGRTAVINGRDSSGVDFSFTYSFYSYTMSVEIEDGSYDNQRVNLCNCKEIEFRSHSIRMVAFTDNRQKAKLVWKFAENKGDIDESFTCKIHDRPTERN